VGSQIALLRVERDGEVVRVEPGRLPIASPVMSCCPYYSRGPRLPHGGVGGADGIDQRRWRVVLCSRRYLTAPTPPVLPA
jgi:hypothetical protein